MTRTEDINVNLYERIGLAVKNNTDLFVSIHANAHAVGADAVNYHGHMTIYNHDFNQVLAETVMENLINKIGLPRARVWQRNDLVVLKQPQIPSILVETAFMMHPDDNWYLLQPIYQREFARAIMDGIIDYFLSLQYMGS
jgi:N-acetylmuramoyl-L-alanine amidase